MKQFKLASLLALILAFTGNQVFAVTETTEPVNKVVQVTPSDPIKMLHEITNNVLSALKQNKDPNDLKSIYSLVNKFILPYVDFNEMSEWVAGRNIWRNASVQAREEFVSAFKVLVVRTYATALNSYTNEKVEFGSQNLDLSKSRIQISSVIVRNGKENIRLNYRLVKHDNKWYVYDVIIEGVSILQGFQAQFSDKIRQQGLQVVTKQIQEHNRLKNG